MQYLECPSHNFSVPLLWMNWKSAERGSPQQRRIVFQRDSDRILICAWSALGGNGWYVWLCEELGESTPTKCPDDMPLSFGRCKHLNFLRVCMSYAHLDLSRMPLQIRGVSWMCGLERRVDQAKLSIFACQGRRAYRGTWYFAHCGCQAKQMDTFWLVARER